MKLWKTVLFVLFLGIVGYLLREFFRTKEGFQTRTFTDLVPPVDPNGNPIPTDTKPRYYKFRFRTENFTEVWFFLKVLLIDEPFDRTGQFIHGIYQEGSTVPHIRPSNVLQGYYGYNGYNRFIIDNNGSDSINTGSNPNITIGNLQPNTSYTMIVGTDYTLDFTNLGISLEQYNTKIPIEYIGYSTNLNTVLQPISSYSLQLQYEDLQRQINVIDNDAINFYNGISYELLSCKALLNSIIPSLTKLRLDVSNAISQIQDIINRIDAMTKPNSAESVVDYLSTEYTVNKLNAMKSSIDGLRLYLEENGYQIPTINKVYSQLDKLDITPIKIFIQSRKDLENQVNDILSTAQAPVQAQAPVEAPAPAQAPAQAPVSSLFSPPSTVQASAPVQVPVPAPAPAPSQACPDGMFRFGLNSSFCCPTLPINDNNCLTPTFNNKSLCALNSTMTQGLPICSNTPAPPALRAPLLSSLTGIPDKTCTCFLTETGLFQTPTSG